MSARSGLSDSEVDEATDLSWLCPGGKIPPEYETDADCDDWKFKCYAMNHGKYVLGFEDEQECREYCSMNRYTYRDFDKAVASVRKPNKYANWQRNYSTKGLL